MQSQNNSYDKLGGFKAELPAQKQGGRERALSCLQMASAETGRMRLLGEKNTIFS